MSELVIREGGLPDLDDPDEAVERGHVSYGRFARLNSGGLWFGDVRSIHPDSTQVGWYWAVEADGALVVSSRGSRLDTEILFEGNRAILAWLMGELVRHGYMKKPTSVKIER